MAADEQTALASMMYGVVNAYRQIDPHFTGASSPIVSIMTSSSGDAKCTDGSFSCTAEQKRQLTKAVHNLYIHLKGVDYRQVAVKVCNVLNTLVNCLKAQFSVVASYVASNMFGDTLDRMAAFSEHRESYLSLNSRDGNEQQIPSEAIRRQVDKVISLFNETKQQFRELFTQERTSGSCSPLRGLADEGSNLSSRAHSDAQAHATIARLQDELSEAQSQITDLRALTMEFRRVVESQQQQLQLLQNSSAPQTSQFSDTGSNLGATAAPPPAKLLSSLMEGETARIGSNSPSVEAYIHSATKANSLLPATVSMTGLLPQHLSTSFASRYQALEHVYTTKYHGQGMEMLWHTILVVFHREFEAPLMQQSMGAGSEFFTASPMQMSQTPAPAAAGEKRSNEWLNDGKESVPLNDGAATPTQGSGLTAAALRAFRESYQGLVERRLMSEEDFSYHAQLLPSLKSEYLSACRSRGVKPNSGILRQIMSLAPLTRIDGTTKQVPALVEEFSLASNYAGEVGMMAVLPVLRRLTHLKHLILRGNGLRNDSIVALTGALRHHAALELLDVSFNPISRAGGKSLLQLLRFNKTVSNVVTEGTDIEDVLKQRIHDAAQSNARKAR